MLPFEDAPLITNPGGLLEQAVAVEEAIDTAAANQLMNNVPQALQQARLCELAKSHPARLLASSDTLHAASETERAHWSLGETVTLRGYHQPTQLASPHRRPPGSIHLTAEHAEEIRTDRLG